MSNYTNLILYISPIEHEQERIKEVEEFTYDGKKIKFTDVNDHTKFPDVFPRFIYAASFNYFPLEEFLLHLQKNVKWEYPEFIQVLVEAEHKSSCSFYIAAGAKLIYESEVF